jgi:HK97 family phage prohead protease
MGKISGYAAVFNSRSDDIGWIEEIDARAFDSVLAKNPDVVCLFNHDASMLLGRTTSGTLRLSVDARGLAYVCLLPNTNLGADVYELVARGDINASSFAFSVKRDEWTAMRDGSVKRRILEFADLNDVSPVTCPAYPATSVGLA